MSSSSFANSCHFNATWGGGGGASATARIASSASRASSIAAKMMTPQPRLETRGRGAETTTTTVMSQQHCSLPNLPHNATDHNCAAVTPTASTANADLAARRTISDSMLRSGEIVTYQQQNTVFMKFSRSGGAVTKQLIATIDERCREQAQAQQQQHFTHVVPPPDVELCVLAQWASDAYYRIVIAARCGIPVILNAMRTFASSQALQEVGCLCISNLCHDSPANVLAMEREQGLVVILAAMQAHAQSLAVQTAACDALRNLSPLLVQLLNKSNNNATLLSQLQQALIQAAATTAKCRTGHRALAEALLQLISSSSPTIMMTTTASPPSPVPSSTSSLQTSMERQR